jgi:hypothetical protein
MLYLGNYAEDATVDFMWSTNAADGSSITRSTNGTISVYKANGTTQSTAGVTDTEDFDSLTGIHHCRIVTTDAFYAPGNDYMVVLSGATIDTKSVNAVLALFSIQNRYNPTPPTAAAVADAVWDEGLGAHLIAGSAGDALNSAGGTATDPWTTPLPGSYTAGQAGWIVGQRLDAKVSAMSSGSPGAGAQEFVYTLTEAGSGDPIADADVWATTDSAGSVVVASGRTDQNGTVTFYLDSGTVYLWRQKSGFNFTNPDTEVIP